MSIGDGYILFRMFDRDVTLYAAVIVGLTLVYLWDVYLSFRQYFVVQKTVKVPERYKKITTNEQFCKARAYSIDKFRFGFCHGLYEFIEQMVILHYATMGIVWRLSQRHSVEFSTWLNEKTGFNLGITYESEIYCFMTLIVYASIFSFFRSMPWSLYGIFVLEERHGFNKQSLAFFLKDKIKGFFLSLVIGMPISAALIWIAQIGGPYFYVYTYIFCLVFSLVMMFIYPSFIAPLFDRYEPLPEGSLRQKIEALASLIKFPLKKLFVVEGSKRSAHSNAYFYGFGKNKRIVLFDTLIKGFKFPGTTESDGDTKDDSKDKGCSDDEEIVAILAHELGHWKMNHILMHMVIGQVNLYFMFMILGSLINVETLFTDFGFPLGTAPFLMRLAVVFHFIFLPYNEIMGFLMTFMTRQLEFQADGFAVKLGYADKLKSSLVVLCKDNLSFPVYDWLYTAMNHSHPNILDRIEAIDALNKKQ